MANLFLKPFLSGNSQKRLQPPVRDRLEKRARARSANGLERLRKSKIQALSWPRTPWPLNPARAVQVDCLCLPGESQARRQLVVNESRGFFREDRENLAFFSVDENPSSFSYSSENLLRI
jgi:hypothetical protein